MSHMFVNNGNYWCSEKLIGSDADCSLVFDVEMYNITGIDIQFQQSYQCGIIKIFSSQNERVCKKQWNKITQKRNMPKNGSLHHVKIECDSQPKYLRLKFEDWSNEFVGILNMMFYGDRY